MKKKGLFIFSLILISLILGAFSWANISAFDRGLLENEKITDAPYLISTYNGKTYIISASKTEVLILNSNFEVETVIKGGTRSDVNFYYAEYVTPDDEGNVYIADTLQEKVGTKIRSERIIKYSNSGKFKEVVLNYQYEDGKQPLQYGNIFALSYFNKHVNFIINKGQGYDVCRIENDGKLNVLKQIKFNNEMEINLSNITCNWETDVVCFTDKKGKIYLEQDGNIELVHSAEKEGAQKFTEVPWWALVDNEGNIYYTDIYKKGIFKISDNSISRVDNKDPSIQNGVKFIISYNNGIIGTVEGKNLALIDSIDGRYIFNASSLPYCKGFLIYSTFIWVCATLAVLGLVTLLTILLWTLFRKKRSKAFATSIAVAIAIIISGGIITTQILTITKEQLNSKISKNLRQIATTISETSDEYLGDLFENVDALNDYKSKDYLRIKEYLNAYADAAYQNDSNLYYLLFKVIDGDIVIQMDYEDKMGPFYPYCPYENSEYAKAYEEKRVISVTSETTVYGIYSDALAPIYNSKKEVVGILEIGTDLYNEQLRTNALIKSVVISVIMLIFIILLALTEMTFFAEFMEKYKASKLENNEKKILNYVRPIMFLIYFANSFDNSFIPQLSEKMFVNSGISLSKTIGSAIPISVQCLFIAIVAAVGGILIRKFGLRKFFLLSIIIFAFGWLFIGFAVNAKNYLLFLLAEAIVGGGLGGCSVSLNSIVTTEKNTEESNKLFSNLNIGLISGCLLGCSIGGNVASFVGYYIAYIVAFIVSLIALLFVIYFVHIDVNETKKVKISFKKFLLNYKVFSYLCFVMLPFLIMLYFKDYVFPLYADSQGITEASIGNILLLCGVATIYLGPSLSKYTLKIFGAKGSIVLANMLYIFSILLFAFYPKFDIAVLTLFILWTVSSFGLANQPIYYTSLEPVKKFGESEAMGISGMFDSAGQTLGPIIFGAALALGYSKACMVVGFSSLVLLLLFNVINIKKNDK